jgi:endonuclease YncB( thermonuclease family)
MQLIVARLAFVLSLVASIANAAPIEPGQIEVVDGDTIRVAGETFRLVGFDAPETYRAQCRNVPMALAGTGRFPCLVAGFENCSGRF